MGRLDEIRNEVSELLSKREGYEITFESSLEGSPDHDKAEENLQRNADRLKKYMEMAEELSEDDVQFSNEEREDFRNLAEEINAII